VEFEDLHCNIACSLCNEFLESKGIGEVECVVGIEFSCCISEI